MSDDQSAFDGALTRRSFARGAATLCGAAATSSLSGVLAACGGDDGGSSKSGEPPGLAAITDPAQKRKMRAMVKAAQKEGTVGVWDTIIGPETWEKLNDGFKEYWGLGDDFDAKYTNLTSSQFVTKVTEEMKANKVTMDVGGSASIVWLNGLVDDGKVMRYQSPGIAKAYSKIIDMKLGRKDYYVSNVYYFLPAWNPEEIDKDITSWNDLLDPEFGGGKMIMGDAALSESYTLVYFGLRKILDKSYFERLAKLKPAFKVKSQDIAQDMATGEHPVAFSGMPTRIFQLNEKGVDLQVRFPKEGSVLIPQSTFMLKEAPHPNAAKLYTEYFLSQEGQKTYVEGEAVSSGRNGFDSPEPKYAPPIEKVKAVPIDWSKVTQKEFVAAREEWTALFKNG